MLKKFGRASRLATWWVGVASGAVALAAAAGVASANEEQAGLAPASDPASLEEDEAAPGEEEVLPSEKKCNSLFCNQTVGDGNYVYYVRASKKIGPIQTAYGFFEVFGRGWKATGDSTINETSLIHISRSVQPGELICLRFFKNDHGTWKEQGSAVCTSAPIG